MWKMTNSDTLKYRLLIDIYLPLYTIFFICNFFKFDRFLINISPLYFF